FNAGEHLHKLLQAIQLVGQNRLDEHRDDTLIEKLISFVDSLAAAVKQVSDDGQVIRRDGCDVVMHVDAAPLNQQQWTAVYGSCMKLLTAWSVSVISMQDKQQINH